jgi:adenylyl-sulfate kinase
MMLSHVGSCETGGLMSGVQGDHKQAWVDASCAQTVWLTGLSGSGKTTIATAAMRHIEAQGATLVLLDGDALRQGLNKDLGYSDADRMEAVRRVAEMARVFNQNGTLVFVSMISPTWTMREMARNIIGASAFKEVFVDTPLQICEARDVKGLYRRARAGLIPEFTGINAPYEAPLAPALHLQTPGRAAHDCVNELVDAIQSWAAGRADEQAAEKVGTEGAEGLAQASHTNVTQAQ